MTTSKRVEVAGAALIGLCATVACLVTAFAPKPTGFGIGQVMLVVSMLAAVAVMVIWRKVLHRIDSFFEQLDVMARNDEMSLVRGDGAEKLFRFVQPLHTILSNARKHLDSAKGDARELQIQLRVADAQKHHTEAIIYSISDAVIVTNKFDELIIANDAATKLFGFDLDHGMRKNIEEVISDETFIRLIQETRLHGASVNRKVVEHDIVKNDVRRSFNMTLSCVMGGGEDISGVVAVLHDVTREKEIARMKTDFVSNVSHELKTPLASIKAYVEMLVDGEAEDEQTQREFYDIISTEADRLHRLIENILNISRIESGVVKVVREPISLTAVAKQVLSVAVPQAKAKNIDLTDNLAPVYCQVEADRDMVYQVMLNLLSNAIKYTPPGGSILLNLSVDESRGVTSCSVTDTGNGIPADDLPHIFDKFYRVEANNSMAKGTGLGLTLVKHIIETVHEGQVSVISDAGKGSTFSFDLPVLA